MLEVTAFAKRRIHKEGNLRHIACQFLVSTSAESTFTAIHVMLDGKRNGFKIEKSSPFQQLFDNYKAAIEWHETLRQKWSGIVIFLAVLFKHFGYKHWNPSA